MKGVGKQTGVQTQSIKRRKMTFYCKMTIILKNFYFKTSTIPVLCEDITMTTYIDLKFTFTYKYIIYFWSKKAKTRPNETLI
jgi:hypothetical protein